MTVRPAPSILSLHRHRIFTSPSLWNHLCLQLIRNTPRHYSSHYNIPVLMPPLPADANKQAPSCLVLACLLLIHLCDRFRFKNFLAPIPPTPCCLSAPCRKFRHSLAHQVHAEQQLIPPGMAEVQPDAVTAAADAAELSGEEGNPLSLCYL